MQVSQEQIPYDQFQFNAQEISIDSVQKKSETYFPISPYHPHSVNYFYYPYYYL